MTDRIEMSTWDFFMRATNGKAEEASWREVVDVSMESMRLGAEVANSAIVAMETADRTIKHLQGRVRELEAEVARAHQKSELFRSMTIFRDEEVE